MAVSRIDQPWIGFWLIITYPVTDYLNWDPLFLSAIFTEMNKSARAKVSCAETGPLPDGHLVCVTCSGICPLRSEAALEWCGGVWPGLQRRWVGRLWRSNTRQHCDDGVPLNGNQTFKTGSRPAMHIARAFYSLIFVIWWSFQLSPTASCCSDL